MTTAHIPPPRVSCHVASTAVSPCTSRFGGIPAPNGVAVTTKVSISRSHSVAECSAMPNINATIPAVSTRLKSISLAIATTITSKSETCCRS
jgi:hypothetical protein